MIIVPSLSRDLSENANIRQKTEVLVKIQPIADHEGIGDGEAHIVGRERDLAPLAFVQKDTDPKGGWLPLQRVSTSQARVRPVSTISSTTSTCRPAMSVSRSLVIRTVPELVEPAP
jgi:hypothetical protein